MATESSGDLVAADQLIRLEKRIERPHVVILGAGASKAACPNGDANGKQLPLMNNLVEIVGLRDEVVTAGFDPKSDFETIYSKLHASETNPSLLKRIENAVDKYFGSLVLPSYPTVYDLLLLSLRQKDAIFTFNWDPFLVDAHTRNADKGIPLPQIFHLHGNVRVSFCERCGRAMKRRLRCLLCNGPLSPTPLLYPIEQKNYSQSQFIRGQWDQVKDYLSDAGIVTIFGYRAPSSDQEALALLRDGWKGKDKDRLVERVEIIDIRDGGEVAHQWHSFSFYCHYDIHQNFYESRIAQYPRRSCESLYWNCIMGKWTEELCWLGNAPGSSASLEDLQMSIANIVSYE